MHGWFLVFLLTLNKSKILTANSRGRNRMPMNFFLFRATASCHRHSTLASQTYEGLHQQWALPWHVTFFFAFECIEIQFFNSHTCDLWDAKPRQRSLTLTCDLRDAMPRLRSTTFIPREAEDFPRGDSYFKHVPLPAYLIYLSPKGLYW